ncbi:MAG: APC family permease [Methylocystis sp.]|uniref:APC family permease n=1 Tax=Methylocystis sp. TaxID=1911079 RepID=UPI003DA2A451
MPPQSDPSFAPPAVRDIGPLKALSIGIGGIVGGGFFATFGLAVVGARGSTFLSFLLGGLVALLTAYSYVGLTRRYPDPAGTAGFVRRAFGLSLLPASVNVLLVYSYICVMAVYAHALGAYAASYFPAPERPFLTQVLASAAILLLGLINYAGAALMAKFEGVFNLGKLAALVLFIGAGLLLGSPDWSRLGMDNWESAPRIVSSGMMAFLAYEGFELISNASPHVRDPARTLPIAYYGSVGAAIVLYVLAIVVAIGHMPFAEMAEARNFALSATAERFLGPFGFALMTVAAVLASASAINADFFGASQLPAVLAEHGEAPLGFARFVAGRPLVSMVFVGAVALFAINMIDLAALSAATSGGFLLVFAAVNVANMRLSHETGGRKWVSLLGAAVCVVALGVTLYDFAIVPAMRLSAAAVVAILLLAVASEQAFRLLLPKQAAGRGGGAATAAVAVAAVALAALWPAQPGQQAQPPQPPAPAPQTQEAAAPAPRDQSLPAPVSAAEPAPSPAPAAVTQPAAPEPVKPRRKRHRSAR